MLAPDVRYRTARSNLFRTIRLIPNTVFDIVQRTPLKGRLMHLPRDPGEWLVMAVLMAALMLALHGIRTHLSGHGSPMRPGIVMGLGGVVVGLLLRLGIGVSILGPMRLLTVRGRTSGQARTVAVDVHEVDGRRYLIATHGIGAWVLNLRAAGEGTLRLGRRREAFRAEELPASEAGKVMQEALGRLASTDGWRGRGLRANLGLDRGAADEAWVKAARAHPVFEVRSA
jgi:deazaflavin-dependent oxidoreductase (nitroreductase family)